MSKRRAELDQAEGELIVAALIGIRQDAPPDAQPEVDAMTRSIVAKLGLAPYVESIFEAAKTAAREAGQEG